MHPDWAEVLSRYVYIHRDGGEVKGDEVPLSIRRQGGVISPVVDGVVADREWEVDICRGVRGAKG